MPDMLRIAEGIELSLDFTTQTQAILAKKGSGKSYTASVQAEELLAAGQQVVVFDPTGAWWGLRASSDGKVAGFPIAVLGGEHGDIPLEVSAGEAIAEAIATDHFPCVLDLSLFRKGELMRFAEAFLDTLYRRNRHALHLFIDEADTVAPQKTFSPEQARALGAADNIVRRGRIRGIGCTLITQRPQVLNKDVLSQVDMLTTLRMNHPKDIGAIRDWVSAHGDEGQAHDMIASLPSLPIGEAWLWAPAIDLFKRAKIRRRLTFDSGATPKAGEIAITPKVLAPVDLAKLGETIAATVERAKDSDPKALRAELLRLRQEIAELRNAPPAPPARTFAAELERLSAACSTAIDELSSAMREVSAAEAPPVEPPRRAAAAPPPREDPMEAFGDPATAYGQAAKPGTGQNAQGRILSALRWWETIGVPAPKAVQVAFLTGYAVTSRGFKDPRSELRTAGMIEMDGDGSMRLTAAGRARATPHSLPTTGKALREAVLRWMSAEKSRFLAPLLASYPNSMTSEAVAAAIGYAVTSRGFKDPRSALRTLGLIDASGQGSLRATDLLFPTGKR